MAPKNCLRGLLFFLFIYSDLSYSQGLRKNFLEISRNDQKISAFEKIFLKKNITFSILLFYEVDSSLPFVGLIKNVLVHDDFLYVTLCTFGEEREKKYLLEKIDLNRRGENSIFLSEKDELQFDSSLDLEAFANIINEMQIYLKKQKEECNKIFYKLVLERRTDEKNFEAVLIRASVRAKELLNSLRQKFYANKLEQIFSEFLKTYGIYDTNLEGEEIDFSLLSRLAERFFELCEDNPNTLREADIEKLSAFMNRVYRYSDDSSVKEKQEEFFIKYSREILYLLKCKSLEDGEVLKEAFLGEEKILKREEILKLMRIENDIFFLLETRQEQQKMKLQEDAFFETLTADNKEAVLNNSLKFSELISVSRFHMLLLHEQMKLRNSSWQKELENHLSQTFTLEKGQEKMDFDPVYGRWKALGTVLKNELKAEKFCLEEEESPDCLMRNQVREDIFLLFYSPDETYLTTMKKLSRDMSEEKGASLFETFLKSSELGKNVE